MEREHLDIDKTNYSKQIKKDFLNQDKTQETIIPVQKKYRLLEEKFESPVQNNEKEKQIRDLELRKKY